MFPIAAFIQIVAPGIWIKIPNYYNNISAVIFECCFVKINVNLTGTSKESASYVIWLIFPPILRLTIRGSILSTILLYDQGLRYSLKWMFTDCMYLNVDFFQGTLHSTSTSDNCIWLGTHSDLLTISICHIFPILKW